MTQTVIKKKRKVYKLEDLTKSDIDLLIASASAPPEAFFCFGMSWFKLFSLNLIDEDTKITNEGIMAVRSFQ